MVLNRFKRCSTSFIIREIQIKTAKRYNFSLIILAGKNKTRRAGYSSFWCIILLLLTGIRKKFKVLFLSLINFVLMGVIGSDWSPGLLFWIADSFHMSGYSYVWNNNSWSANIYKWRTWLFSMGNWHGHCVQLCGLMFVFSWLIFPQVCVGRWLIG